MPAQNLKRTNKEGIYSHVYNRGVSQGIIFNDMQDYEVFLSYLKNYLTPPAKSKDVQKSFTIKGKTFQGVPHQPKNYYNKVSLIAYCLMPNHFHLLLYQSTKGSLEKLMRSLCIRYAIYFNKKYQRTGSLFEGPYKSAQIKNTYSLVYLSRYFHHTSKEAEGDDLIVGYSSYAEYLGKRKTSWINTNIVLSLFEDFKNKSLKGIKDYKNFVERYDLTQNEKELLQRIIIEKKSNHTERSVPLVEKKDVTDKPTAYTLLKPHQRLFEYAISSFVFTILFTSSFINIWTAPTKTEEPIFSLINRVSSLVSKPNTQEVFEEIPEETSGQVSGVEDIKPKTILVVKTGDSTVTVNIRQSPTTSSKIIGQAKDGDTFEFISENSGWYQVKLDDSATGFISTSYMEKLEINKGVDN